MRAADTAALVAGPVHAEPATPARIRVLRAFRWEGGILPVGAEHTIADAKDARALAAWGKAEILPPSPEPEPPAPGRGRKRASEPEPQEDPVE